MHRSDRINLNTSWHFRFDGEADTIVDLPHSWNAFDTMEGTYRRDIGIYSRSLNIDRVDNRRLWLEVEAASQKAQVFADDEILAEHLGGYTAFTVALPRKHDLQLRIEVDNRPDPDLIPSDMSDFFLYGGLTRNVWLYSSGPVRLEALFFDTQLSPATITLWGRLSAASSQPLQLEVDLYDPMGQRVLQMRESIATKSFEMAPYEIPAPLLWSPDHPHLYRAIVRLQAENDIWDSVEEHIGFRHFEFPAGGPFYLNGERLLLTGTHRHEDWAGYASAVPDELTWQEMRQLRDAGFNFIRLGHYPQTPAVLEACDQLGIIVWEELPWCRGGVGDETFKAQARHMLTEMIEQHYNHPSILFWGLGNELDWESEHPHSTDEKVVTFLDELHELSHQLDSSRLTALRRFEPGANVVDVYSPSIWSGWYRGRYEDYEVVLLDAMQRYPRMLHMEWGGDNHVGRHNIGPHIKSAIDQDSDHSETPGLALSQAGPARASRDSDWSESYMLDVMEWHLRVQHKLPNLAGTAQWAFKDFGTPLRPENPIPYINQKGLVDRSGRPKDVYYLFQSYLTTTSVCYIESPSWPIRNSKRVRVYSNCQQVELFINGISQGKQSRDPEAFPAMGLVWEADFAPGENNLKAIGYHDDGTTVVHQLTQLYQPNLEGPPYEFVYQVDAAATPDGQPALSVSVQLIDEAKVPVLHTERRVSFVVEAGGRLWTNYGIPDGCQTVETANGRASAFVIPAQETILLRISADDIAPLLLNLTIS